MGARYTCASCSVVYRTGCRCSTQTMLGGRLVDDVVIVPAALALRLRFPAARADTIPVDP